MLQLIHETFGHNDGRSAWQDRTIGLQIHATSSIEILARRKIIITFRNINQMRRYQDYLKKIRTNTLNKESMTICMVRH